VSNVTRKQTKNCAVYPIVHDSHFTYYYIVPSLTVPYSTTMSAGNVLQNKNQSDQEEVSPANTNEMNEEEQENTEHASDKVAYMLASNAYN
jgi:hypothetical protein